LHKTGQAQEAINAYEQAIELRPHGCEALANLACLLHQHDDVERARDLYERVIVLQPHHTATLWNLGLLYEKQDSRDLAEKAFADLVAVQPDRQDAWLRLGYLRLDRGDAAGAIDALENIATKPKARSDARVNLAVAYWREGRLESAKTLMQRALKEQPNAIEFLRVLAAVAVAESNADEAARLEAKLDQLGERIPELSYNVGVLLENARRHEDAVPVFERAAKARPGFGEALLNMGHALKALGQVNRANECWQEAIAAMPELAAGYFGAGAAK
jgi:tetratricopeptide (TPR) repeat protein